ncbi:MAG: rod shape-determining protein MreD [Paenibacillaceae bacterium]|nr:rod shape-determining protein MreD [Paenibacillaceae bacterium]
MRNVRRSWITLLLFALFLLEGTVLPWLTPSDWQEKALVSPHLVLVAILYTSLYTNRHLALAYGIGFGLLQDFAYYGPMIGTNSFAMGLSAYMIGLLMRRTPIRIVMSLFGIAWGVFGYECIRYGLYRLFQLTSVPFEWSLLHEMLPSLLIDLLFALAVYVPARKWLERLDDEEKESAEE